jgi:AcrR family transcriptional regulator
VRRTRKLLRDALIELIEERGFDRLTVGEITKHAMVSRAAFYRNYNDKFHLVEQIFDDAMAELLGTMDGGESRPPAQRWVSFFEHIEQYHRFYGALLGKKGSMWFAAKMRASLSAMVEEHLQVPDPHPSPRRAPQPPPAEGLPATVLGALFTQSIIWWLDQGMPSPPRVIAMQSAHLASAVITAANSDQYR